MTVLLFALMRRVLKNTSAEVNLKMWILFEPALRGTAKSLGQNCGGETVYLKMQENLLQCNCYVSFDIAFYSEFSII